MAAVTLSIPVGLRMGSYEEEEFGIVPLMETPTVVSDNQMINDCFFGSDAYAPSPLFRRRVSNESVTHEESKEFVELNSCQPNFETSGGPFDDQWFAAEGAEGRGGSPSTHVSFCEGRLDEYPAANLWESDGGSLSRPLAEEQSSWIEEWMDMNGIFDPSNDVACSDIDLPDCQSVSFDQGVSDEEVDFHKTMAVSSVAQGNPFIAQRSPSLVLAHDEKRDECTPYPWNVGSENMLLAQTVLPEDDTPMDSKIDGKKSNTRSFVLRPVSRETARLISPLPLTEQHPRSAKVIKASYAVDSGIVQLGDYSSASSPDGTVDLSGGDAAKRSVNPSMIRKCATSPYISERKREQNRSAAVRYREKRREEAKRKKEELHELELRNVELKTQVSGLSKEIAYLRGILDGMLDR